MNDLTNRWDAVLHPGEELCWEGRPAPRCYTFRHWRHSIFGLILLAICLYWQILGIEMGETYAIPWLPFLPVPFLFVGVYFSFGHLLQARLEWNNVCYAMTNRRLLAQRGLRKAFVQEIVIEEITYFKMLKQGEELATLTVHRGTEGKIILHCIEHPQRIVILLEEVIRRNTDEAVKH